MSVHRYQLNVMFVGGPNERKDYHIEEGEEVQGDMCLKIIENGRQKDVVIREGEMFLLPARIPHSPQRYENTVGLVVERERLKTEIDGLSNYIQDFCEKSKKYLRAMKLSSFTADELLKETPFPLNSISVMEPFSFSSWLNDHRGEIKQKKSLSMFGDNFETEVIAYGPGTTEKSKKNSDIWIWQLEGTSTVAMDGKTLTLSAGDSLLVRAQSTNAVSIINHSDQQYPAHAMLDDLIIQMHLNEHFRLVKVITSWSWKSAARCFREMQVSKPQTVAWEAPVPSQQGTLPDGAMDELECKEKIMKDSGQDLDPELQKIIIKSLQEVRVLSSLKKHVFSLCFEARAGVSTDKAALQRGQSTSRSTKGHEHQRGSPPLLQEKQTTDSTARLNILQKLVDLEQHKSGKRKPLLVPHQEFAEPIN
ncbi:hypothetical protein IHE44_0009042 [Lamprotornis superbus]|uniref:3-hydroxyanthranilate 3,4-dioxygenase n=1 Tax=Lamprotornis superbus TaxID=245042 RepID=A0A835NY55_9PASS|nr:hypothetical protein IHE44_0009042 [Lamprotornis superbus]